MALQIVLAEKQVVFRTGMARVLAAEDDIQVVAQCADVETLKEAVESQRKSIVVFSSCITSDLGSLLDCIERADSRAVLILEHDATVDPHVAQRVEGIVLRSVAAAQLVDCLRRVSAGERCVQSPPAKNTTAPDRVGAKVLQRLTPKELQIVSLVAEGAKNREIADQLGTKEQVVKNYLRSIYDKTGVSDRLELALFTIHHPALNEAAEQVRQELARAATGLAQTI
jgi:DNA-binding NarL/FixJ family response regulator